MKLKKVFMLCIMCCVSLVALADDYSISAGTISTSKGTSTSVLSIYMTNVETISALQFDIYLPTGVEVYYGENDDEEMVYFVSKGDRAKTSHVASSQKLATNTYRVVVASQENATFKETETNKTKPVVTIRLDVSNTAVSGVQNIVIKNIVLSHYNIESQASTLYYPSENKTELVIRPASGTELSEANGVCSIATAEGTKLDASSYSSLTSGKTPIVVDLRSAELADDVSATTIQNANANLYYLPSGSSIIGKNIVVDGKCLQYEAIDGQDVVIPSPFTATAASYSRTMSNTWGTICLPYAVVSNTSVAYYKITGIDNDVLTIEKYETLPAGTPALVKKLSGSEIAPQSANVAVNGALNNVTGTVTMKGSYTNDVKVEDANAYYIKNNKFYLCNEYFFVDAFRAYFTTTASAKNAVLTIGDDEATAINALTGNSDVTIVGVYDASGAVRSEVGNGLNIVKLSNGKTQKILVK